MQIEDHKNVNDNLQIFFEKNVSLWFFIFLKFLFDKTLFLEKCY